MARRRIRFYPIEGIRKILGAKTKILYAQGSPYVEQLPVPVPSSVYHLAERRVAPGLKGEYFDNVDFSGNPALTRIDPQIQFDWNAAAPVPGTSRQCLFDPLDGHDHSARAGNLYFSVPKPAWHPAGGKESFRDSPRQENRSRYDVSDSTELGGRRQASGADPFRGSHFDDTKPHDISI